jgi:hypothetical protein
MAIPEIHFKKEKALVHQFLWLLRAMNLALDFFSMPANFWLVSWTAQFLSSCESSVDPARLLGKMPFGIWTLMQVLGFHSVLYI